MIAVQPCRFVGNTQQLEVALPVAEHHVNRSEEHTSELQSRQYLVCRLLLEKKNNPYPPSPLLLVKRSPRATLFPFTTPRLVTPPSPLSVACLLRLLSSFPYPLLRSLLLFSN